MKMEDCITDRIEKKTWELKQKKQKENMIRISSSASLNHNQSDTICEKLSSYLHNLYEKQIKAL